MLQTTTKIAIKLKKEPPSEKTETADQTEPKIPIKLKLKKEPDLSAGVIWVPKAIEKYKADFLYNHLKTTINWDSIGTRQSKAVRLSDQSILIQQIAQVFAENAALNTGWYIYGAYLNYYRDGNDYAPKHRHKDTTQMILSLNEDGGQRDLKIFGQDRTQTYIMDHGDVIVFGADYHTVLRKKNCHKSRISIALFMRPLPQIKGSIAYI